MKNNNIEELKKKLLEIHDRELSFMEESEKMYIESIDNTISNINSIGRNRLQEKIDEIKKGSKK